MWLFPHLAEHEAQAAIDPPVASYNTISRKILLFHAEIDATMAFKRVVLAECTLIHEEIDPLPRRQLPLGVLRGHTVSKGDTSQVQLHNTFLQHLPT